jgi:hypothetical protein
MAGLLRNGSFYINQRRLVTELHLLHQFAVTGDKIALSLSVGAERGVSDR